MTSRLRITTLAENTAGRRGLLAEHGLALGIDLKGRAILFDTGQGTVLARNAKTLDFDLCSVHDVILSHGHYDHTGGLHDVIKTGSRARVFTHPAALQPKYACRERGTSHDIGMSPSAQELLRGLGDQLVPTKQPTEVCDGLFVTGEIPRQTEYEDTGGPFCTDEEGRQADPLLDDQAVFMDTRLGTVVLLGCSHAGVINTLRYIRELTSGRPIHAVVGGMHLVTASRERMDQTIDAFRELDVARMGPAHCTGLAATMELWRAFPGRCFSCTAGTAMEFELR